MRREIRGFKETSDYVVRRRASRQAAGRSGLPLNSDRGGPDHKLRFIMLLPTLILAVLALDSHADARECLSNSRNSWHMAGSHLKLEADRILQASCSGHVDVAVHTLREELPE